MSRLVRSMRQRSLPPLRPTGILVASLCAVLTTLAAVRADEDDDDDAAPAVANVRQIKLTEQSFDQMVFGGQRVVRVVNGVQQLQVVQRPTADDFRSRMESIAASEIQTVDGRVSLTEAQKKKLRLAARGDVAQHISRAAELRPKLTSKPIDQAEYTELMKQLYPLRMAHQYGFLGDNSLFRKTLRTVLTEEQRVRFQRLERERQAANIEAALQNMERIKNGLQLTGETRRKFAEVILEHGQVPQNVGPYGQYIVLLEANLIRDRVLPLLSEAELEKFESQLVMAKRVEPTLAIYGMWTARRPPENDDDAANSMKD